MLVYIFYVTVGLHVNVLRNFENIFPNQPCQSVNAEKKRATIFNDVIWDIMVYSILLNDINSRKKTSYYCTYAMKIQVIGFVFSSVLAAMANAYIVNTGFFFSADSIDSITHG